MKKLLVCLTVLFSAFLFTNKVNAEDFTINQLGANFVFHDTGIENYISNISEENIDNIINDMIDTYQQYDFVFDSYLILYVPETNMYDFIIFDKNLLNHTPAYNGMKLTFLNMPSSNIYRLQNTSFGSPKYSAKTLRMNLSDNNLLNYSFQMSITDGTNARNLVDGINHDTYNVYYYTNVNNYKIYEGKNHLGTLNNNKDNIGNVNEFTINTYDTEFGGDWFGVNYVQGEQDNTVNFYIQDSGILYMSYAKGYEIEKIYYDESLTQEANLNDIVETDTNLYVTWKSKIEINKQIATDLSGNDVITINYDFSKIYNENYSYLISNDGTNYVDITDKLNSEYKYSSGVYFAGDYFAMVKDENNETISVHYINIDYYRITPTTEIGKDIDENGNIKPYVILDYSAYREIKNNIICEYSIDNGNTWIDITKELDINMKYKLYINVGDKVTSRVRTNGNTILPGETGGSNYDVTEDFYNDILINEEKDVLEEFKDLLTNKNDNIFIKFKEVWETFKDSVLFNYIYILIVGSLIILIIKSAKRN